MSWQKGPVPSGTLNWAAIVLTSDVLNGRPHNFHTAHIMTDHIIIAGEEHALTDVAYFNVIDWPIPGDAL